MQIVKLDLSKLDKSKSDGNEYQNLEVSKITSEEWKNMTEEQKRPYEVMAKKNKEKYVKEVEAYKQKTDEEAANLMKEEEEHMKLQKQEALQLLKKKEKTENIIKGKRKTCYRTPTGFCYLVHQN